MSTAPAAPQDFSHVEAFVATMAADPEVKQFDFTIALALFQILAPLILDCMKTKQASPIEQAQKAKDIAVESWNARHAEYYGPSFRTAVGKAMETQEAKKRKHRKQDAVAQVTALFDQLQKASVEEIASGLVQVQQSLPRV